MKYYAMIDIGASSGRIMLAEIDNKQLALQEVHRFKNGFSRIDGSDRWDIENHFRRNPDWVIQTEGTRRDGMPSRDRYMGGRLLPDRNGRPIAAAANQLPGRTHERYDGKSGARDRQRDNLRQNGHPIPELQLLCTNCMKRTRTCWPGRTKF